MKLKSKKMLFICLLFLAFFIFNGKTSFCYETNEFGFKHDGTDEVSFNRSTMELTVNGKIYKISFNLPEDYTNFAVVRASATLNDNYGVLFLPASAEKLILPVYSSDIKNYCNDFTIYYFARPNYMTSFPKNYSMAYFNACFFSTIDVYQAGSLICAGTKVTPKINPILYIDDQNLRKRFKFEFEIPVRDENTKYYVFLQKYTRNNYDSVTATFSIYTVDTPEGYDATNYENYMYYDLPSKKLYLPAGCLIKQYEITSANNDRGSLKLINEFTAERMEHYIYDSLSVKYDIKSIIFNSGLSIAIKDNDLVRTDAFIFDSNFNDVFGNIVAALRKALKFDISSKQLLGFFSYDTTNDYFYNSFLKVLYYGKEEYLNFNFEDFAFSNFNIVSYENTRNTLKGNCYFYNYYRKTRVYNQENKINDNMFVFNYSDGQDVSSLLPDGIDVGYLTSPWYKDNESSSSKGNITYDIKEILQGDKLIDYSKTDNSIHNNFYGDYIEKFEEGDNITINNYYTQVIDKTSDNNLLHNIYVAILEIKQILSNTNDKISNTTNNFTYNINNTVTFLFVPSNIAIKGDLEKVDTSAKEHLGIIYEPFDMLIYTITLFTNLDNSSEIVLSAPAVVWKEHEIIPATHFSFNEFFELAPEFKNIHDIYLMSVDFTVVGLLLYFAYKKFKEVFNK